MLSRRIFLALGLLLLCAQVRAGLISIPLKLNGSTVIAEVANTEASRNQGLMGRASLRKNHGMLFVFAVADRHGFWMKNTLIPLSIAFLDEQGVIVNIRDMSPHSEQIHSADGATKYALEMDRGWFAARGIKPGRRVEGLQFAPPAQ